MLTVLLVLASVDGGLAGRAQTAPSQVDTPCRAELLERIGPEADRYSKEWAAVHLGRCVSAAGAALVRTMADDNWSVRRNTAAALGEVGAAAAAAIPALVDALDEYREDEGVGRAARHALEEIGLSAVPALLEVLRRGDLEGEERPERWHNATIVLRDMGPTVVPLLLGGLSGNDNEADGVAMVLTMLDPPARVAIPQLIACLQPSRSALVRAQVAAALSKMAPLPIEAVGPLAAALEEPWSRASAARALGSMGSAAASALPALERALQSARGEQGIATDEQVILEAIGKIRQERVPIR